MASEAEVDLVISTADALPELSRDLSRIITQAEDQAPELDVQASLAAQNSLAVLSTQLDQVLRQIDADDPNIDVEAALDAQTSLRNLRSDLDELTRAARSGGTDLIDLEAQLDFPASLAQLNREIEDLVATVERGAPEIEIEVDLDDVPRAERILRNLGRTSLTTARGVGTLLKGVAGLSLAVGGGATAVAGLVAALQQVAPAAAVGTSALLTKQLAAGTLRLAMIGVQEAIEGAFDPELSPDEFQKSLETLAPEARRFVEALHAMRGELRAVQQEVQNRVFRDFDTVVANLAENLGPTLTRSLNRAADSLNAMGRNAATAALQLGEQGVLGKALDNANLALEEMEDAPGRVVRSFGFLAAASGPALNRIATAVDAVSLRISERLQRAFESGALESSIDEAVATLAQFGRSVGNILGGVRNIFSGLTQDGRGLFDILEELTGAFEELTASEEFQRILGELAKTADTLVVTALPLLKEAFVQLAPVIEELAPVVREFVKEIGPELIPIIEKLGPILVDLAKILKEQLPLAIKLANAALQTLGLALDVVKFVVSIALRGAELFADFMESDFGRAMGLASNYVLTNSDQIKRSFTDWTTSALGSVVRFQGSLLDFSGRAREILVGGFRNIFGDVLSNTATFIRLVIDSFGNIPGRIRDALGNLSGLLYSAGADIVQGLINGITSKLSSLLSVASSMAGSVAGAVGGVLEIFSPSRVMYGLGEDTGQGFVNGIYAMIGKVRKASQDLAEPLTGLDTGFTSTGLTGRENQFRLPSNETTQVVNVQIGNKFLARYVDERVTMMDNRHRRVLANGVRR